jgi:hypothetical protein
MTPEELQIIQYGKMSGRTQAETMAALANFRSKQAPTQPAKGFLGTVGQTIKEIPGDLRGAFQGMQGAVTKGIETADEARSQVEMGEISPQAGTVKTIGAGLGAGAGVVFEGLLGAGKSVLPKQAEQAVGDKVGQAVKAVVDTKTAQNVVSRYQSLTPEQKAYVDGLLGTADGLTTVFGLPIGTKLTGSAVRGAERSVASRVSATGQKITDTKTAAVESLQDLRQNYPQRFEEVKTFIAQTNVNTENPVATLKDAYQTSFIADNKTLTKKLKDTAVRANTTPDALLQKVAERGYLPKVDGKLADFTESFESIKAQQRAIIDNEVLPKVNAIQGNFSLDALSQRVDEFLRTNTRGADLDKALAEMNRIFASYRTKYGTDDLTPAQVNRIRVDMNSGTDAYKRAGFEIDTEDAIAKAIRAEFDRIDPSIRESNAKWADLQEDKRILSIMDNQPVNVGMLASATGRLMGTIVASGAGLSVAGPGGLVIAGAAAALGSDFIVNALRQRRFALQIRDAILRDLSKNPRFKDEFLSEASPANQKYIENELLALPPAKPDAPNAQVFTPISLPDKTRSSGSPVERAAPGAVRTPDGEPRPTAVQELNQATEAALDKMEASIEAAETALAMTMDGGRIRTSSFPNWLPDKKELRTKEMMRKVYDHIKAGTMPDPDKAPLQHELWESMNAHFERMKFNELQMMKKTGITYDNVPFSLILATGAGLAAYYTMQEDGSLVPLAFVGMMSPALRQGMIKRLDEHVVMLEKQAANTTNKNVKNRLEKAILSAKDEARKLRAEEKKFSGKDKGATPPTTLLEEAKKYKSAEEFKQSLGKPYFHGAREKWTGEFNQPKEGEYLTEAIFVAPSETSAAYYDRGGGIKKVFIDPKARLWDYKTDTAALEGLKNDKRFTDYVEKNWDYTIDEAIEKVANGEYDWVQRPEVLAYLRKKGYDGFVNIDHGGGETIGIFSNKTVVTEEQIDELFK